jgi:hypothetical protein
MFLILLLCLVLGMYITFILTLLQKYYEAFEALTEGFPSSLLHYRSFVLGVSIYIIFIKLVQK